MTAPEQRMPGDSVVAPTGDAPAPRGGVARATLAIARVIAAISTVGMGFAAAAVTIMLGYITWYVLGRYLHFWAPPSASQVAAYLMAACFFLGLAYVFRVGGFIVMAPLKKFIPQRALKWVEATLLLITLAYVGVLAWYATESVLEAFRFGTRTYGVIEMPLWIPQIVMPIGLIVWFLQVLSHLLQRVFLDRPAPSGELAEI